MTTPWSLQRRLGLALLLVGGATLGSLFVVLDFLVDHELHSRFDDALVARGRALAGLVEARPVARPAVEERWPEYAASGHQEFYQVWDDGGATVARSASSHATDLARPLRPVDTGPVLYDLLLPDGHRGRAVAFTVAPPADDGRHGPRRLLVVATEREALEALEARLHASLVVGILGALALMGFAAVVAVRRGLAPLADFGRGMAARASAGRLRNTATTRPEEKIVQAEQLPHELQPIAQTLDRALDQTLAALAREQRFARAAAHELRTPLAELRVLAEGLPRTTGSASDVATITRTIDGMTRAVEALLALARCEAGLDAPVIEPLDLVALVQRQLDLLDTLRATRGIALDLDLPAELWVNSDAAMLERILANLLANAIGHAPPSTRVAVAIRRAAGALELVIANDAPNLDAAWLDGGRGGAGQGDGHAGLGLALARALGGALGLQLAFALAEQRLDVVLRGLACLDDVCAPS
ncbi:MAG: sensor histidine kinase [Gammaproteobacteria bacterium]